MSEIYVEAIKNILIIDGHDFYEIITFDQIEEEKIQHLVFYEIKNID